MEVKFNLAGFSQSIAVQQEKIQKATRPAAQAGAQVCYEQARLRAPVGQTEHFFYGSASKKAPKGSKKAMAYGPFKSGSLRDAMYQVYSERNSNPNKAVYQISWNREKAPYGHMVELGTSRAAAHPFLLPAMHDSAAQALQAMSDEFSKRVSA